MLTCTDSSDYIKLHQHGAAATPYPSQRKSRKAVFLRWPEQHTKSFLFPSVFPSDDDVSQALLRNYVPPAVANRWRLTTRMSVQKRLQRHERSSCPKNLAPNDATHGSKPRSTNHEFP